MADIREAAGPQKGIHDGMEQHVGVGVAQEPSGVGNLQPPKVQGPAVIEAVNVVALAHPEGAAVFPEHLPQPFHVFGGGDFEEFLLPRDELHRDPQFFQHRRIVGEGTSPGEEIYGPLEQTCQGALGGLGPEKAAPFRRFHDAPLLHLLDGVDAGHSHRHGRVFFGNGLKGFINGFPIHQGPGPVVDEDFVGVLRHQGETVLHGSRPVFSPLGKEHLHPVGNGRNDGLKNGPFFRFRHNDQFRKEVALEYVSQGIVNQRVALTGKEELVQGCLHAAPAPCGHQYKTIDHCHPALQKSFFLRRSAGQT